MENNIPETARLAVILQYWGQQFEYTGLRGNTIGPLYFMEMSEYYITGIKERGNNLTIHFCKLEQCKLLLKPLGEISEEDKVGLGLAVKQDSTEPRKLGSDIAENILPGNSPYAYHFKMALKIADFLRSRGYAIPYGPYSVEQLEAAGIYKLTK